MFDNKILLKYALSQKELCICDSSALFRMMQSAVSHTFSNRSVIKLIDMGLNIQRNNLKYKGVKK